MNFDPGILCLQHCGPQIFCFEIPENCPACRKSLVDHQPTLSPFRLPYPFVRAFQHPCAVVIKPTNGDFLNDYKISLDLHIGVTTGSGDVFEYDQTGLHRNRRTQWNQCLIITQVKSEPWSEKWDDVLTTVASQNCWSSQRYHQETFNCYTFVLAFLRCLHDDELSEAAKSKVKFCEIFISPRTIQACTYISLYRRLKDSGYYVNRSHFSV
uniref:MKRN2 opposite strand protein n=1 Tax=Clastoptera arizonana TaxID=38151 RepID=A0A1B6CPZ1_9HEMI